MPLRLVLLLLFTGAVLVSLATPSPVDVPAATAATPLPAAALAAPLAGGRKLVHSWDKLRITVRSGVGHRHGNRAAADGARVDPDDPSKVLIKAPRRFVPKPNSPTCPDGTDADHKGTCRPYW